MAYVYGSLTDMAIKTSLGKMATLKYVAEPQLIAFTYTSFPYVESSSSNRNYSYSLNNFPPTTGNDNFKITDGTGNFKAPWIISERETFVEIFKTIKGK